MMIDLLFLSFYLIQFFWSLKLNYMAYFCNMMMLYFEDCVNYLLNFDLIF